MQPVLLFDTANLKVYKFLGPDGSFWVFLSWEKSGQSMQFPISDAKQLAVGLYAVCVGPREPEGRKGVSEF